MNKTTKIKIIGTGLGLLFFAMNANAVESGADYISGANSGGTEFVLELSAIDYSYPASVLKGREFNGGSVSNTGAAPETGYEPYSSQVSRAVDFDGFRLTAGMLDLSPSKAVADKSGDEASIEKPVLNEGDDRIAVSDGRFKLAVGLGTTSPESDIVLDARPETGASKDVDHAELAGLLNEAETEATVDLEDYLDRPVLAIGVNYAF